MKKVHAYTVEIVQLNERLKTANVKSHHHEHASKIMRMEATRETPDDSFGIKGHESEESATPTKDSRKERKKRQL